MHITHNLLHKQALSDRNVLVTSELNRKYPDSWYVTPGLEIDSERKRLVPLPKQCYFVMIAQTSRVYLFCVGDALIIVRLARSSWRTIAGIKIN